MIASPKAPGNGMRNTSLAEKGAGKLLFGCTPKAMLAKPSKSCERPSVIKMMASNG